MDALTEVLKSVQLQCVVHCRADLSAPWGVEIDRVNRSEFHVIVQGSCWLEVEDRKEPIPLVGGDFVVLSKGTTHRLRDALESPIVRLKDLPADSSCQGQMRVQYGGGGTPAMVLCGNARFENHEMNPLLPALPSLILIRGKDGKAVEWLDLTLKAIAWETADDRPGSEMMIAYLSNILFIQAIRAYVASLKQDDTGWLRALRDPQLSAVLTLIHQSPEKNWTVDSLAKQVNLSRSTFAARFKEQVGEAPLKYLTQWRMHRAIRLLRSTNLPLVAIAEQVGYQSEAAFSKAFKRQNRQSPGEYRKSKH